MTINRFLTLFIVCLSGFAVAAEAQRTTKRPVRRTTTRTTPRPVTILPPLEVRAARQKVSNQLSNVNRFIDLLGPVAQSIETLDSEARARRISKASIDQNEASKQKVIQAIRNLRAGLVTLEADFRTKRDLSKYLPRIQGISDLSARSEDAAIAGRFVASKDPLRRVAQKLADTLAALR